MISMLLLKRFFPCSSNNRQNHLCLTSVIILLNLPAPHYAAQPYPALPCPALSCSTQPYLSCSIQVRFALLHLKYTVDDSDNNNNHRKNWYPFQVWFAATTQRAKNQNAKAEKAMLEQELEAHIALKKPGPAADEHGKRWTWELLCIVPRLAISSSYSHSVPVFWCITAHRQLEDWKLCMCKAKWLGHNA